MTKTHPAVRQYLNLHEMFERAKHISYVVISNYERLPFEPGDQIDILTDDAKGLAVVWELVKVKDNLHRSQQNLSTGNPLRIRLFEKGKRTFPDSFESQLLARRVRHSDVVSVPDAQSYFLLRMYWRTFFENLWQGEADRGVMIEFLRRHVGEPISPKDKTLHLNKQKTATR